MTQILKIEIMKNQKMLNKVCNSTNQELLNLKKAQIEGTVLDYELWMRANTAISEEMKKRGI
jgi:hypothetical protein